MKNSLKRIAFVAMPFRTKPTGLKPGSGPESVNYDALWEQAVKPALIELDYMPLRADEQSGTVIIKDMLTALVHADLVLADISIPNGNVYYEAGIRHAAKETGCILLSADWTRALFDLKQITQIRYPLASKTPTANDYLKIKDILVKGIPALADSKGPVYDLVTQIDSTEGTESQLRKDTSVIYDFDTKLTTARLKAGNGDKESLRAMCDIEYLTELPSFALKELIDAVRDNLNWSNLVSLIDSLPEKIGKDAHFQEQKALALSMGEQQLDAIGILKEVIKHDGETCLRMGSLGSMYRHLATTYHMRYERSAIRAFREGMSLDLNDYYCSHKLLVMLVKRNRSGDKDEAVAVGALLEAACDRAVKAKVDDEWLYPTLLILAFYKKDIEKAMEYSDRVIELSWSNWKLTGLLIDLLTLLRIGLETDLEKELAEQQDDEERYDLLSICRDIQLLLPVPQEKLMQAVFPLIKSAGATYQKKGKIHARSAVIGEEIVSVTKAGEDTSVRANENEVVVRNNTDAKELYIMGIEAFESRYDCPVPLTDDFQEFEAKGQSLAIEINHEITTLLGVGAVFFITPSWQSEQYAKEGDYFVCPLPEKNEIYRVGKPEFEATYRPVSVS